MTAWDHTYLVAARQAGERAWERGVPLNENPFTGAGEDAEHAAWRRGWIKASEARLADLQSS